ncbi:MAG: putative porin [bacterium]|nr:putative porin [bacterium]
MKKLLFVVAVALSVLTGTAAVKAGEIDLLVDKLVEKGILTRGEAQQIITETQEEVRREVASMEAPGLPKWVQKMSFKGDLRLRYQWTKRETNPGVPQVERNRGRYRLRFGVETYVVDNVSVGFGVATGDGDPRSTNQTFTNSFEKPSIRWDYAYAKYSPADWITFIGGKMQNPLWRPTDLVWDTDITPEGGAVQFKHGIYDNLDFYINAGLFVLDESAGDEADPLLYAIQPGFKWKPMDKVTWNTAGVFYGTSGVKGKVLNYSANTNKRRPNGGAGGLAYDYDTIGVSSEIVFDNLFDLNLPRLAFVGEYYNNIDVSDEDYAWIIGFKMGDAKVGKKGQWQAKYLYRWLCQDAVLDILPDSDAYGGATGVRGHEVALEYALLDNVIMGLDYYHMEPIHKNSGGHRNAEDLFQADILFKF